MCSAGNICSTVFIFSRKNISNKNKNNTSDSTNGEGRLNLYGSLSLRGHCVGVKVSAGLAAALVPAHVLAQVLLSDHPAVKPPTGPPCTVVNAAARNDTAFHRFNYTTPSLTTCIHLEDALQQPPAMFNAAVTLLKTLFQRSLLITGVVFTRKCYLLIICVIF